LIKALPKLANAAAAAPLRQAFEEHLEQTRGHATKLEQVFASIQERVRGKHCAGMAGIIEEGQSVMSEPFDAETMDACLIAGAQRAEHYEMAAYGTLIAWAKTMGHREAVSLLEAILAEEKAADAKLSKLAESGINQEAVDDDSSAPARPARKSTGQRRRGAAAKRSASTRSATRASSPRGSRPASTRRASTRARAKSH
jgi:ferritin-like metal-binding protein YciE